MIAFRIHATSLAVLVEKQQWIHEYVHTTLAAGLES